HEATENARRGPDDLREPVEDVREKGGCDALAVVGDENTQVGAEIFHTYVDPPVPWRELDRVRQQVPDDLLQPVAVTTGFKHVWNVDRDRDPLRLGGRPQRVERAIDDAANVDGGHFQKHLAVDDPRHVEDVLDQLLLRQSVALDHL